MISMTIVMRPGAAIRGCRWSPTHLHPRDQILQGLPSEGFLQNDALRGAGTTHDPAKENIISGKGTMENIISGRRIFIF